MDEKKHERVELPEPVILVGTGVHIVLLVARLTPLEKPFRLVMLIVEVPTEPRLTVTLVGVAVMMKSWTMKVIVTE